MLIQHPVMIYTVKKMMMFESYQENNALKSIKLIDVGCSKETTLLVQESSHGLKWSINTSIKWF